MTTFLLVHGALRGAWLWELVLPLLLKGGANPVAIDLPGHGTRSADRKGITMSTYIDDVIGFIRRENLQELVLVGHSMSGMIISKVAEEMPERVKHLVYLAAVVPRSNSTLVELLPQERQEVLWKLRRTEKEIFGTVEAMRAMYFTDLEGEQQAYYLRQLTPQPLAVFFERIPYRSFPNIAVPKTYLLGMKDRSLPPALTEVFAARLQVEPLRIDAGHDMMVSRPGTVAESLLRLA